MAETFLRAGGNKNDKQKADDPFGTMWAKFRSMPPLAQAVVAIVVGNVLMTWLASMMGGSSEGPGEQNEISQHTLLTKVLEEGQVQDITIRDNVALVRMKDDPRGTFVVKVCSYHPLFCVVAMMERDTF